MGKTKSVKAATIQNLEDMLKQAKGVAFVSFEGLKVKDVTKLRKVCRAKGVTYLVAKKTLLKLALERVGAGEAIDARKLAGGIAVVFGKEDELTAAKTIDAFSVELPVLKFVGGLLPQTQGWQFLNAEEITLLAKLPGKQELLGKLLGTLLNPMQGIVTVLSGNMRSFVQVLSAIGEAKAA